MHCVEHAVTYPHLLPRGSQRFDLGCFAAVAPLLLQWPLSRPCVMHCRRRRQCPSPLVRVCAAADHWGKARLACQEPQPLGRPICSAPTGPHEIETPRQPCQGRWKTPVRNLARAPAEAKINPVIHGIPPPHRPVSQAGLPKRPRLPRAYGDFTRDCAVRLSLLVCPLGALVRFQICLMRQM